MDIKISKSARVCRGCERDFVHEEPVTSLVRVHEQQLQREDYCAACWRVDRAADAFSYWATKYYDPRVAEQEPAEAFSPLRQLFYEALEATDRVQQAKAFLAAQLLRRQKVFRQIKESDEADGETKIILFNDRIGNRLIEVRDPHFTYAELEEGRVLLVARLMELENPAPAQADAEETGVVAESGDVVESPDGEAEEDVNADEGADGEEDGEDEDADDEEYDEDDDDEDDDADEDSDDYDDDSDDDDSDDEESDDDSSDDDSSDDDDDDDDEEYDDDDFEDDDEEDEYDEDDEGDVEEVEETTEDEKSSAHVQSSK